jgi:hypothetical protein
LKFLPIETSLDNMVDNLLDGFPLPSSFPSAQEVRDEAYQYATQIFEDQDTLQRILDRQEEAIRRRWSKKSKSQKIKILLEAWPNMAVQHRPDIEAWRRHSKLKEPYMWPSFNLEDLTKSRNLLILLHARGRHQPHEFIHADVEQASFGETGGAIMPVFLNGYTMFFHGRTNPKTYGELVSWDENEDAFDNLINGVGLHPGHGLKGLEIQQRIWHFLVSWCKILLSDIPFLTQGKVLPDPGPLEDQETEITSLEIVAMEAPYRIPARLDFTRLKAIAAAERNAREDHIWNLREDPSYFAEVMQEYSEHRQEILLDKKGHAHPSLREPGRPKFWNRILENVVVQAYFGFANFDEISRQIESVELLYDSIKDDIEPTVELPAEILKAFQNLRFILDAERADLIQILKVGLFPSPPMRKYCLREPQNPQTSKIIALHIPPPGEQAVHRIMSLLSILFNDQQLFLCGLHTITDELGRLIESDAAARALISPFIGYCLSSLSVVSECLHQLHLFQPWARKIEEGMILKSNELESSYKQIMKDWVTILGATFEHSCLYRYADPSDGKFNYPVHRRRSRQNTQISRKAETNLDNLWRAIEDHYKTETCGLTQHDMVTRLLSSSRVIQRIPEWIEPDKAREGRSKNEPVIQQPSAIIHDRTTQVTGSFDRGSIPAKPAKIKTRGHAAPASVYGDPQLQATTPQSAVSTIKIFKVDKRTHRVFCALFHSPNDQDLPGEIAWMDFLHALVAIGFSAEKVHGSAWNFVPRTIDAEVERSIQFHEPHPSNKIPFHWARRYGRRLARAYGWTLETFILS